MMQWTAPTLRHRGARYRPPLRSGVSPLMAITYRQNHLRGTSASPPRPDIPVPMSAFCQITSASPPTSDIAFAALGVWTSTQNRLQRLWRKGLLTGHSGSRWSRAEWARRANLRYSFAVGM